MAKSWLDEASCPACQARGLEFSSEQVDLPFLGPSLETMLRCLQCGYRHADFILTEQHGALRSSYRVARPDDMMVRVVRGSSGTIRIPELGIVVEPGSSAEAFVSNIEGILVRVERVLDHLHRDSDDAEVRGRIESLQDRLGNLRTGRAEPVTVVLEDPFGNSRILHEDALLETLDAEEAGRLHVGGTVILDAADLEPRKD